MAEETPWISKAVLALAIVSVLCLPVSALGHRFGLLELMPAFGLLALAMMGGVLVIVASVVNILVGKQKSQMERVMQAWLAIAIAVIPVGVIGYQTTRASGVPPIHDISTDTEDPPLFERALTLRGEGTNPVTYGTPNMPREKLVELQKSAYPDIQTIRTSLSMTESFDVSLDILSDMDLEVTNQDRGRGILEAVDTTFWYGFKDDLVVRVRAMEGGTLVDLRSLSRVGESDLGVNAARITRFMDAFKARSNER